MREMNHTRLLHNNKTVLSFCGGTNNLEAIEAENYSRNSGKTQEKCFRNMKLFHQQTIFVSMF